ncbi:MAG TPA: hypothetical protein VH373_13965 [Jatrophihabitantaceae bacterium]|jgi:hypothetical protein
MLCSEVADNSTRLFGHYVGHDEPELNFYSTQHGSGNSMQYSFTLPKDPPPSADPRFSYSFELRPALWFGMVLCDTQSYPEQVSHCTPDSDRNIVDPNISPRHPGAAFMELQFYPPGWVQQFDSQSCDAIHWCAALTIDSLAEDPVAGTIMNPTCANQILGGVEYVNFAYLTRSGRPQGPPNPLQFDPVGSGKPDPRKVLMMNQGDKISLSMHDTGQGVRAELADATTHQSGSMTASARNGFGQIRYAPTGTSCTEIPYDFHPMYDTSSPVHGANTLWAAHSGNVAFSDEIGHFDFCSQVDTTTGTCTGLEGVPGDQEPADDDDFACFPASASTLVPVTGCNGQNDGFDGTSYLPRWPNGSRLNPTSILFSSPTTKGHRYPLMAFEADLPAIESAAGNQPCSQVTGTGCTLIPITDDGAPAAFYPFYTKGHTRAGCRWSIGNDIPGFTQNDFGRNAQFGQIAADPHLVFGGGGAAAPRFANFRQFLANPC